MTNKLGFQYESKKFCHSKVVLDKKIKKNFFEKCNLYNPVYIKQNHTKICVTNCRNLKKIKKICKIL